jgi:hypothetical protein
MGNDKRSSVRFSARRGHGIPGTLADFSRLRGVERMSVSDHFSSYRAVRFVQLFELLLHSPCQFLRAFCREWHLNGTGESACSSSDSRYRFAFVESRPPSGVLSRWAPIQAWLFHLIFSCKFLLRPTSLCFRRPTSTRA